MRDSTLRNWMYAWIIVNVLLWMGVLAGAYGVGINTRGIAVAGFLLGAASQHWAYYALWNVRRAGNE